MTRQQKRPWPPDDVTRMLHMREVEKKRWSVIDEAFGRTHGASAAKYELLRREPALSGIRETGSRLVLPPGLEADRAARKKAELRRDLTAERFGDPPPGFSALDRRKSACSGLGTSTGPRR